MAREHLQILLIEDSPADAKLLREMFAEVEEIDIDMDWVNRLSSRVDRYARGGVDVVLLDLGLPDSQGLDTLRAVHSRLPRAPVVVLTGLDPGSPALAALREGAQDYLVKCHLDSASLVRSVRYAIERKRIKEELALGTAILSAQFELCPDGILVVDERRRVRHFNRRFMDLWRIPVEVVQAGSDKRVQRIILSSLADPRGFCAGLARLYGDRHAVGNEELALKDGRTLECRSAPMFQAGERYCGRIWFFRDITERKWLEVRRGLTSQILATLNRDNGATQLVKDILRLIKKETDVEAVGIRLREGDDFPYYETSGFPASFVELERHLCAQSEDGKVVQDANGQPFLECLCGNVLCGRTDPRRPCFTAQGSFWTNSTTELLAGATEKERQAGTRNRERNRCNAQGYESVALVPLRSGDEIIGLLQLNDHRREMFTLDRIRFFEEIGASIGIALARQRTTEALRSSREIIEGILNAMPVRVFWKDKNLVYLGCNAAFARDAGFADPKDLVGKDDYQLGWRDRAEAYRSDDRQVIESDCPKLLFEEPQTTPEGKTITLLTSKAPLRTSEGKVNGLLGMYMDITERKRLETERAALLEQLRQAQKMESVGRLAGGVAHDFNNILTGIGGYTELALDRLDAASPAREDLAEAQRLATQAAGLTRQLLAFSRRQPLTMQTLNLNDMIANTGKLLKRLIGEDIDLQFAPAPGLGNVRADAGQIEQVLMNLALNSRDAMPTGGKLTIETANVDLDAEYAGLHIAVAPGLYVMLAVSDTGHGMDAATKARLFEPFFTTKEKGRGTGLGLATVYGIVKQHGGNIWVYSEPGKGATFKIYLPRVAEAVPDVPPSAEPEIVRGEEMILVVEDEASVGAFVGRVLSAYGYKPIMARSAVEAERAFLEQPGTVSLLLTDVILPGMNGRKLYELLKSRNPDLKVLYMSGYTDNAIVHQGVLDIGIAFMQKPFTTDTLVRNVRQVPDG